jgi:hypothetical protein
MEIIAGDGREVIPRSLFRAVLHMHLLHSRDVLIYMNYLISLVCIYSRFLIPSLLDNQANFEFITRSNPDMVSEELIIKPGLENRS